MEKNCRVDVFELGIKSSDGLSHVWVEDEKIVGFICAHDLGFRGSRNSMLEPITR